MESLNQKDFEALTKKIAPIKKLAFHDDADGVTAAVLLSYVFQIKKVWAPEDFGVWPIETYKEGDEEILPPDVCVDMIPQNPKWKGLAIDHHPDHLPEGRREYQLIQGNFPTSVMVYSLFRDYMPEIQRWKVVVGAVGDGQPEVIPPEIWREFPLLLDETLSLWEKNRKLKTSQFPLYLRLSSPINAACKLPGKWYTAYSVLRNAKSPWDILNDPTLKAAKEYIQEERERVFRESTPIQLRNGIQFWKFTSETKLERTLAFQLWSRCKRTIVVLNTSTGRGSIRGTLATLVYEHLANGGFQASGHPGFGGLRLRGTQTAEDVYICLASLKL